MSKSWNYAQLVTDARRYGGPERYISHIRWSGRVEGIVITTALFGVLWVAYKFVDSFSSPSVAEENLIKAKADEMTLSDCKTQNKRDNVAENEEKTIMTMRCDYCGGSLKGAVYVDAWEDGNNPQGYWICPHCGNKVYDDSDDD